MGRRNHHVPTTVLRLLSSTNHVMMVIIIIILIASHQTNWVDKTSGIENCIEKTKKGDAKKVAGPVGDGQSIRRCPRSQENSRAQTMLRVRTWTPYLYVLGEGHSTEDATRIGLTLCSVRCTVLRGACLRNQYEDLEYLRIRTNPYRTAKAPVFFSFSTLARSTSGCGFFALFFLL